MRLTFADRTPTKFVTSLLAAGVWPFANPVCHYNATITAIVDVAVCRSFPVFWYLSLLEIFQKSWMETLIEIEQRLFRQPDIE